MNGVGFAVLLLAIGSFAGAVAFAISWMSRRTARTEITTADGFAHTIASIRAEHERLDAGGALHHERKRVRGD